MPQRTISTRFLNLAAFCFIVSSCTPQTSSNNHEAGVSTPTIQEVIGELEPILDWIEDDTFETQLVAMDNGIISKMIYSDAITDDVIGQVQKTLSASGYEPCESAVARYVVEHGITYQVVASTRSGRVIFASIVCKA